MFILNEIKTLMCLGFAWNSVNFLHSRWHGGVFLACDENSGDSTLIYLLLTSAYTELRTFQLLTLPCCEELGVRSELRGDKTSTVDPDWWKREQTHCMSLCSAIKSKGKWEDKKDNQCHISTAELHLPRNSCLPVCPQGVEN